MSREKTISERGKFKFEITPALYKNKDIVELILGNTSGLSQGQVREQFKEHVQSHFFIDDTITEKSTYIFYDVIFPKLGANIKDCRVIMYAICHRDVLDDYEKEGFYGNRADILAEMIADTLLNDDDVANSFGIGKLNLDSLDVYNSLRFYGVILTFNVPNFR